MFSAKYKLFFKKQFGLRNNHSTSHALINLIDLINRYLDNDWFICGVFIDLHKGFDILYHKSLLAQHEFPVSMKW